MRHWLALIVTLVALPQLGRSSQKVLQHSILDASDEALTANSKSPPYRNELLRLHRSLVEIPSISGDEGAVGRFLIDYLTERGYTAELQFVPPQDGSPKDADRYNVLAWRSDARQPTPRVLLTSHIDVVPPYIPYSIADEKPTSNTMISGRGSVDAKASIAAQIIALQSILEAGHVDSDKVMMLFVVGEENTGDGMKLFSKTLEEMRPPAEFESVIFGEPTENKLACGHKGGLFCYIQAVGLAGHSGYPWLGKSATELLIHALARILETDFGSSDKFGNTTINIGQLSGGVASNVIPASARADLALRIAIGPEDGAQKIIQMKIQHILDSIDPGAFDFGCYHGYGVVETNCDVEGFNNITVNYGTDVPNLKGNHARYLYGPGDILVAHSDRENLTVGDLETAVEGFRKLILHALKARHDG